MLPVEAGDEELRAGLKAVREPLGGLPVEQRPESKVEKRSRRALTQAPISPTDAKSRFPMRLA
jgi:hypothetical protein